MDIDTKTDKDGLKILNKENEVFSDLLYQDGAEYGETLMSFIEMDNDSDKCAGWMITFKQQLIDVTTADDLADSIKNNEIICPKFQLCGESGTFIRKELFHLLKFGQKSPGRILNQRAEQSRRKEYSSYIKHYDSVEDIREIEFYSKYPMNDNVEVPPAFRNDTDLPQREIAIRTLPTVSCKDHRMVTFIKTGRGNIKQRELIREMVTAVGKSIQPYFVIGLGSDDIQNEIDSHGDLIEGDFIDTYENLPLKTMLGYQFAVHNCANVDLFFYQDDDIFMRFDDFLQTNIIPSRDVKTPFMICPMGGSAPVNPTTRTNYFRKHYSPIDLLPPNYKIVPYCNGPCVLLTSSAVENLYNASLYTDRQGFRIEDMYFNGIIRLKAGIELNPTIPGKNGQRKFCEHILEGDKYSIIKQKLTKYKNDHPNL